jgi:hypothetical protein
LRSSGSGGGEGYDAAIDAGVALLGEGLEGLDGRGLAVRLGDVERTVRELEAVAASIVATADRREEFGEDGHVSVRGWVKASIRLADHTVTQRVRTAKLCAAVPRCHGRRAAGALGVDQGTSWRGRSPTRAALRSWPR